jgi:hypothetical protein
MSLTLNIGLLESTRFGGAPVEIHRAIKACQTLGEITRSRLAQSATELTLVIQIRPVIRGRDAIEAIIFGISDALFQDCIAWHDGNVGSVTGKEAALWGAFSPEYFLPIAD